MARLYPNADVVARATRPDDQLGQVSVLIFCTLYAMAGFVFLVPALLTLVMIVAAYFGAHAAIHRAAFGGLFILRVSSNGRSTRGLGGTLDRRPPLGLTSISRWQAHDTVIRSS